MTALSGEAVVTFTDVSKSFGDVVALSDVTCRIPRGMTALLGPNGAGKSTLMRLLVGMAAPTTGTVRVFGADPMTDRAVLSRVGLVPQQERLFRDLSALDFVRTAARLQDVADDRAAAMLALQRVELDAHDSRPVGGYSKGMRQRVKLAQAIVHEPDLIVLDEPLNGLDPRQRQSMIALFRQIADAGLSVIVSSHVLDEVEKFGSDILLLAKGRVLAEGDYRAIREALDDRPHRIRVRATHLRDLAAALVGSGVADGVQLGDDELILDTLDIAAFGHELAGVAASIGARLSEVEPLDDNLESVFRYLVEARPSTRRSTATGERR